MRKKIKIIAGVIFLILILLVSARIYYVNKDIKMSRTEYFFNVPFEENNVIYTVKGYSFEDGIVKVTLNVKNNSESDQECDFTEIKMDYNDDCKNVSMATFYEMGAQEAGLCTVTPPGDEFDIVIPYVINSDKFDYKNAELIFELYPIKKYLRFTDLS